MSTTSPDRVAAAPGSVRNRWTAAFFVVYVTVQVAVPTIMLAGPRPSRFGWQMYAGFRSLNTYTIVRHDASTVPVDLTRFFGSLRADVPLEPETVVPHICRRHPEAKTVRVREVVSRRTQDYACDGR